MSDPLDLSIDLEKAFLPAWAQKPADAANPYAKYDGSEGAPRERRGSFGDRPPRRDGPGGGGGARPGGGQGFNRGPRPGGPAGPGGFGARGPRPGGPRPGFGGPGPGGGGFGPRGNAPTGDNTGLKWDPTQARPAHGPRRDDRRDAPYEQLIPVEVDLRPDPAGVNSLGRQIKLSGRAYPLAEVSGLVVQKPDRYEVTFRVLRGNEGKPLQKLFVCTLDDSVWLSEADALHHALKAHFDTFYQTTKQPCDPPKGVWTLVAMFDDIVLGPPNYHGYQERLREVHAQRGARMPFDFFKSRVRIVKDEAAVKAWLDAQSHRVEYTTLNVAEPKTLIAVADVEAHFRETHAAALVKEVSSWRLNREPNAPRLPEPLLRLLRVTMERERRFPIKTMTALSSAFAQSGLQFFKRDKTVVHVSVARPHYLDLETVAVQPGIKKVIEFIDTTPKATRKKLMESLAPTPSATQPVPTAPEPVTPVAAVAEATAAEPTTAPPDATAAPAAPVYTAEQQAVLGDLHWLIHQGHVIEFANGALETAKKPAPRPEPAPAQPKAERPPKKERAPRPRGRYVSDNVGLLPLPAPNAALIG